MNICKIISYYRNVWRIEKELSQYTDRELNDIGISRSDIPRIARETI